MQTLIKRYGENIDWSRADWMVCKSMAISNRYSARDIKQAMAKASPNVDIRKVGHLEDYVNRTVDKVMKLPEVKKAIGMSFSRGKGFSM